MIAVILSGKEIKKHIGREIVIKPFDERRLNPNSYNLSHIHGEYEPYQSGKYQNNTGIQPSLMFRDFEK